MINLAQLSSDLAGIPLEWQVRIGFAMIALKYLLEGYSAIRNGGGLKRILMAFWFGENLPKVVAVDYKQELNPPPSVNKDP